MSYPPYRSGGFLSNVPPIVKNLIIINLLAFLAIQVFGENAYRYCALHYPQSPLFMPHQLFTHMFLHGSFLHLLFNMYALWMFGSPLEQTWGSKKFLSFYLITGIGAALFYSLVQWVQLAGIEADMTAGALAEIKDLISFSDDITSLHAQGHTYAFSGAANDWFKVMVTHMVGASGAVFGVLLGFGMLFSNVVLRLLFPPIALKAKYFVVIYGAIELYLGISQPGSSIAHFAHIGGMVFGFILIMLWRRKRTNQFWS